MDQFKEVYFHNYCYMCKHADKAEEDEPCCDCLEHPENVNSHVPTRFEKGDKIPRMTHKKGGSHA